MYIEVGGHLVEKLLSRLTRTYVHRTDCSTWTTEMIGNECHSCEQTNTSERFMFTAV